MERIKKSSLSKYLSTRLFWSGGLISIPMTVLLFFSSFYYSFNSFENGYTEITEKKDSVVTISLSFVGDLMCHSPQYIAAKAGKDSFDFKPAFQFVKENLSKADFTFGNLETVLGGKEARYSGYPMFNSPDEYLEAIKDAGFDFLFTSNNHSMDRGENGVLKTLDKIRKLGLNSAGTFQNQNDRDSIRVIRKDGFKIAILSYTFGTNGNVIPKGKSYLVNLIDDDLIHRDIDSAKSKKVDLVLCYFHFGNEYQRKPGKFQIDVAAKAIDYGADIIIASHPHVLQPITFYKKEGTTLDSVLVAYSLGNFISNQRERYKDAGAILNLTLEKNVTHHKVSYKNINYIPTWVYKSNIISGNQFSILPLNEENIADSSLAFLSLSDKRRMAQTFQDSKQLLNKEYNFLQPIRN